MTSSGRRWAFLVGALIAFALPVHVDCGFPGARCRAVDFAGQSCTPYELEPAGFYAIEWLVGRDVGFAYSSDDCR